MTQHRTIPIFLGASLFLALLAVSARAQDVRYQTIWGGTAEDWALVAGLHGTDLWLVGGTTSFGAQGADILLLKADSAGAVTWARRLGGSGDDGAGGFELLDSSGELYFGGTTSGFGAVGEDVLMTKLDPSGNLAWARRWGGNGFDHVDDLALDPTTGDVYGGGGTDSFGTNGQAALLLKYGSGGTLQWASTWDHSPIEDSINGVALHAPAGLVYAAGNSDVNGRDALLLQFDSLGVLQWARTWGGAKSDDFFGVTVDSSGNAYTWGATNSLGAGKRDVLVVKWDSAGNLLWAVAYGTADKDDAGGLTLDAAGRVHVVGSVVGCQDASADGLLLELDPTTGLLLRSRAWGSVGDEGFAGAVIDAGTLFTGGQSFACDGQPRDCAGVAQYPTLAATDVLGAPGAPSGAQPDPAPAVVAVTGGACSGAGDVLLLALGVPIGEVYCHPAVDNSTGMAGEIEASGSLRVADGDLTLSARHLPPNQFGYFLTSDTQGFVANPGGSDGNLCLGGAIGRFRSQVQNSGTGGRFSIEVDLQGLPFVPPHAVLPGETWNFQAWHRDIGGRSNFTDATSLLFE